MDVGLMMISITAAHNQTTVKKSLHETEIILTFQRMYGEDRKNYKIKSYFSHNTITVVG
jgi:hypothetical protein